MTKDMRHHYPSLALLQKQQLAHDLEYSRDIMGMSEVNRLTHYTLHQAKYIGHLVGFDPRAIKFTFNDIVTNSFVVMLATANALKIDLEQELKHRPTLAFNIRTPQALGMTILAQQSQMAEALIEYKQPAPTLWGLICAQMPAARRAKKAFNTQMRDSTLMLCRVLSGVNEGLNMDMDTLVAARLEKRARTNLFHPQNPAQQRLNSHQKPGN